MQKFRNYALSIAGFDPSAGAGILGDIKTFENNHIYGLGVCSAITIQNDIHFKSVEWIPIASIQHQTDILFERYPIEWVKIGLIENFEILSLLIHHLYTKNKQIKIIWDPILKASAGFEFHSHFNQENLIKIFRKLYLITPNYEEIKRLFPAKPASDTAKYLSQHCAILLKGGHRDDNKKSTDCLFTENKTYEFIGKYAKEYSKHGSGCVLSSALLANLAKGYTLPEACEHAKKYIQKFLESNHSLLGYH